MSLMFKRFASILILPACLLLAASVTRAQSTDSNDLAKAAETKETTSNTTAPIPVFTEYQGITIGMSADEVRKNLKQFVKATGNDQDLLVIADKESAQVFYNDKGKVTAISIDYVDGNTNAPTAMQVLGREVQARADGSLYVLQRYPAAGYWVSYNRTSGEHPLITVTMQAM